MYRHSFRRPIQTSLRFEQLEDRTVLAGDVTASLIGTTLHIVGDAADNSVRLEGRGEGIVEVRGINTTVNGSNKAVNFSNISSLIVDVADGDDTVRSNGLELHEIDVRAGSGDDTVQIVNTSSNGDYLFIAVAGDSSATGVNETNGNDTISVSGTRFQGNYAYFSLQGDHPFEDWSGGRDQITLANTKIDVAAGFGLDVLPDYGSSDPGNIITIENFDATATSDYIFIESYIDGGLGDDTFNLKNINMTLLGESEVIAEFLIGSAFGPYYGNDTINVENVNVSSFTTGYISEGFPNLFNQTFFYFNAETVRIRNLDLVGGGTFFSNRSEREYYTGGYISISANKVDVRNTSVHTNGFGGVFIRSAELNDGIERDDSWTLANVQATSAGGERGELEFDSLGGNDEVHVTNASSEFFTAYLGEGDDTLSLTNVSGNMFHYIQRTFGGIYGGGGHDTVELVNCTFPELIIELGEGDDAMALRNNTFGTLAADLGDGDDIATLINNAATHSISLNGGLGIDELTLRHNIALMLLFENFEL